MRLLTTSLGIAATALAAACATRHSRGKEPDSPLDEAHNPPPRWLHNRGSHEKVGESFCMPLKYWGEKGAGASRRLFLDARRALDVVTAHEGTCDAQNLNVGPIVETYLAKCTTDSNQEGIRFFVMADIYHPDFSCHSSL